MHELGAEVAAARQAFLQTDRSYNVGLVMNLRRLTAQDDVLSAQLRQASKVYDRPVIYLDLLWAAGRLVEAIVLEQGPAAASTGPAIE